MAEPFLGEISPVAFDFAPRGWALCNGQLLSINQHTALFSLLGTMYGGDGVTTFALPDLRGRAIVHSDSSAYTPGVTGGVESVTLGVGQIPAHSHAPACVTGAGGAQEPAGAVWAGSATGETLYQTGSATLAPMASGLITGGGELAASFQSPAVPGRQLHHRTPGYLSIAELRPGRRGRVVDRSR